MMHYYMARFQHSIQVPMPIDPLTLTFRFIISTTDRKRRQGVHVASMMENDDPSGVHILMSVNLSSAS